MRQHCSSLALRSSGISPFGLSCSPKYHDVHYNILQSNLHCFGLSWVVGLTKFTISICLNHECWCIIVLWLILQSLNDTPSLVSVLEPGYWIMSQHCSCLVLWLMGWPLPCTVISRLLKPWDSTVSCLALRLRVTPFMHRVHASWGHETAPYHASFSGRWVRSCLAPFHACSIVLRQHRFMPSSRALSHPDSTVSCFISGHEIAPFMPTSLVFGHETAPFHA